MEGENSAKSGLTRWSAAMVYEDMWVDPEDDPRSSGGEAQEERTVLVEYLRDYRLTLEIKCAGLDAEQMARRSVPPSTMSLLGIIRHLADVERNWFRWVMAGTEVPWLTAASASDREAGRAVRPVTAAV
jgi:hypothetical protein